MTMIHELLISTLSLFTAPTFGQTFVMNGTPIASCTGIFLDGGGPSNYSNNQNLNTTICPDGTGNTHVLLSFDSTDLATGDQLCFYDGSTILAPLLACADDFPTGSPFQIQASASNPGGCLTLHFQSDASVTASGWSTGISCASPCVVQAPVGAQLVSMGSGNITWSWADIPGSSDYEVSVNGGPWIPASSNLSHTVTGLSPGSQVVLEIRPIPENPGCSVTTTTVSKTYAVCTLEASIISLTPATCPGTSTGSANIGTTGAMGTVQFFVDNNPAPFPNGNLTNMFAAGNHVVIVQDTAGCRDTINFNITEPPPLTIDLTVTDANCFGDDSGEIMAAASGGTPNYTYVWRRCQGGPNMPGATIIDLFAGCYQVTVTDSRGCTAVAQDTVGEPEMFQFLSMQDSVSCFGGMDGVGTVFVSGAMPPYTFLWGNGDTTQTADSLKAAFHTVTITDAIGCQAVTLVQVLQPPRLLIDSISLSPITCFGANNGSATVFAHGGVKPYAYSWNNTQTGVTAQNLGAGTYTVTLTDNNGCTVSSSTLLDSPPELTLQISNIQAESCSGACDGQMLLTASGGTPPLSISWSDPSIPPNTTNPQNLCAGNYQVTVTDAKNCSQTQTATIQAAVQMTIQFASTAPSCAGGMNGSITATANGGTGPYQYQWSNSMSGGTIQNLPCGTYTVTATDSNNCSQTAIDTLPCAPPIQIDSIPVMPVQCFGLADGQVAVFAQGGSGMLSYLWSDANQQTDPVATNLGPGVYTVTVSDANNCSATASASVTEPTPLTASITSTNVDCFGGNNGTALANASGGTQPYQFSWSVPQTTPEITGLAAGTYSLTVTDANGCPFSIVSIDITEPATPVQVTTTQISLACFGSNNAEALAEAMGSNGPPYDFSWSNSTTGPNPNNFSSGTYTVTATDGKGCTGTQSISISEYDSITVNIASVSPTCNGSTDGQAAVNQVSGGAGNGMVSNYMYAWSVPGSTDTIYIGGLVGNQNYSLTVTDNSGCSAVSSFFLADQPAIIPVLQSTGVSCFGESDGTANVTSIQSVRPIATYEWSNGATGQMQSNLPAGTYTLEAIDNAGCTGTATVVVSEPALLELNLDITPLACNNDKNGAIIANVTGGTPIYRYFWNNGTQKDRLENLGPGNYAVTIIDNNGCSVTDSTIISQPNPPTLAVDLVEPGCHNSRDGVAQIMVTGGIMPYRYSLNGQSYMGSSVFLGLAAGEYVVSVLDGLGCVTKDTFTLNAPPPIEVELYQDTTITLGDSLLLSTTVANAFGMVSYSWQGALVDSFRCADSLDCSEVWVFPVYSNTYRVTVTDENGCQSEARVFVTVEKPRGVYVPTGFSPNGDGNNDLLVVYGKSKQVSRVKIFRVFDRWGELVYEDADFEVNNEQRGWNGLFRGQESQVGIYVWYAEVEYVDGFEQILRGDTALIR